MYDIIIVMHIQMSVFSFCTVHTYFFFYIVDNNV